MIQTIDIICLINEIDYEPEIEVLTDNDSQQLVTDGKIAIS